MTRPALSSRYTWAAFGLNSRSSSLISPITSRPAAVSVALTTLPTSENGSPQSWDQITGMRCPLASHSAMLSVNAPGRITSP